MRKPGQKEEQRHVDGIEDFIKHGRIAQQFRIGRGMAENNHKDRDAFCDVDDFDPSAVFPGFHTFVFLSPDRVTACKNPEVPGRQINITNQTSTVESCILNRFQHHQPQDSCQANL